MYLLDLLDSLTRIGTVWISTKTEATLPGKVSWFSAYSVASPRSRGKVREEERAEGFTPKSVLLGHKPGMSHREIKRNIYVTSTHFSCFLQNQSNCKTVIWLKPFNRSTFPIFQRILCPISITEEDETCVFKLWGSNLSQFFKIKFKEVVLELLAPICKREKSGIHSCGFFPPEASLPRLDGGVDRLSTEDFLPLLDLVCRLPTQVPCSSLPILPLRWGGDAPRLDLMASQVDLVPYHQDLCLICPFVLMWPGVEQSSFPRIFSKGLLGEASILFVPVCTPESVLTTVEAVSHKGMNNNQDISSECCHITICESERVGQRGKSDFCPQAIRANPSSSFPQIPQKEYLRSWDKNHQRASSGPLRASATKGRNPLHFQSDQILQFPICVLMVTSRAFIHIDRRHSCEKVSLLGHWPLRQAAKRVTSTLREVPGARAPPRSCNFWLLGRLGTSIHGV